MLGSFEVVRKHWINRRSPTRRYGWACLLPAVFLFLNVLGCKGPESKEAGSDRPSSAASTARFSPDIETDAVSYAGLVARLGEVRRGGAKHRIGAVVKFFGDEYWDLVARGMSERASELRISLDIQAAATDPDPEGQLAVAAAMLRRGYAMLMLSPQTDGNLGRLVAEKRQVGRRVLNVLDGVLNDAGHWVGPNQYENGVMAAGHLLKLFPEGGKVAVIKGLAGVYSVERRTEGFVRTLEGTTFRVVAQVNCDWDLQTALNEASAILKAHPDLKGFYCNDDIMALGAFQAVKAAGRQGSTVVIGSGGITEALESIKAGEMTATVSTFPREAGRIAVDVAVRILAGQAVPRVVRTPQTLVTGSNVNDPSPSAHSQTP